MGASSSKPIKVAAGAASRRQYPKKPSPSTTNTSSITPSDRAAKVSSQQRQAGSILDSGEKGSSAKSEVIDLDARDPHFAASLRSIGPVTPHPTLSNSSTFNKQQTPPFFQSPDSPIPSSTVSSTTNPALLVLSARAQLEKAAESELEAMGRHGHPGREFLDIVSIKQILAMRDREGVSEEMIERQFRLKKGVVGRLGVKGVVGVIR
ncbi:hypothetical protein PABG_00672 [Paracoccidioides brasiliensis Pb03]|uniref:Helix-turn-helix domain-containing protein n=1 Tax=Paracoccidioides brasiliensis TaxID=121759 RepID=A0A1D2J4W6_PARBR|nr:hypothetical protein PABG_00672 [Paracoccidioides brasiliensis Pb03]ODH13364.1 hypothetical protein ACO22_07334 [Paracoccidioides brasiliensis]ODH51445.1 hypothetical protein GX48_02311 [Paracoccidioides brasiliensis]